MSDQFNIVNGGLIAVVGAALLWILTSIFGGGGFLGGLFG